MTQRQAHVHVAFRISRAGLEGGRGEPPKHDVSLAFARRDVHQTTIDHEGVEHPLAKRAAPGRRMCMGHRATSSGRPLMASRTVTRSVDVA
jgi:hypothetical protein